MNTPVAYDTASIDDTASVEPIVPARCFTMKSDRHAARLAATLA